MVVAAVVVPVVVAAVVIPVVVAAVVIPVVVAAGSRHCWQSAQACSVHFCVQGSCRSRQEDSHSEGAGVFGAVVTTISASVCTIVLVMIVAS